MQLPILDCWLTLPANPVPIHDTAQAACAVPRLQFRSHHRSVTTFGHLSCLICESNFVLVYGHSRKTSVRHFYEAGTSTGPNPVTWGVHGVQCEKDLGEGLQPLYHAFPLKMLLFCSSSLIVHPTAAIPVEKVAPPCTSWSWCTKFLLPCRCSAPQWDLLFWGNLSAEGSCLLFTNLVSAESGSGCAAAQTRGKKKKPSDSFSLEIAFNPALQKATWHSFLFKLLTTGLCETWPCLPCFFVLLLM